MIWPPLLTWILRMDPTPEGPPEAINTFTRELHALIVYLPGRLACPTTSTFMDLNLPSVTFISKFLKTRPT